jgi:hypothetical protein
MASPELQLRFEDAGDSCGLTLPLFGFASERFMTFGGELVILRATIVLGRVPFGANRAGAFHAAEGGEQGTGIDAEDAVADLLNAQGNAVTVHGLQGEGFEDQHFQGSLDQVAGVGIMLSDYVGLCGHASVTYR